MASYSKSMQDALNLINQQSVNLGAYFETANNEFENQYKDFYGTTMQDAFNALASTGIYDSPVSENALNRKRKSLSTTYATGKSQLAGQKMSAEGAIDQQKINYYQNLANLQYQESAAKTAAKNQMWGTAASIGTAILF